MRLFYFTFRQQFIVALSAPGISRAYGTAMLFRPCARAYPRLPHMPLPALPPCAAQRARHYHIRFKLTVKRRMPLGRDLRIYRRQIVKSLQEPPARAVRTALQISPRRYGSAPRVAERAFPPHSAVAVHTHILGSYALVFIVIPLLGQLRHKAEQVIFALNDDLTCAVGTACAVSAGGDRCLPRVPFLTPPPHLALCAGHDVAWR